MGDTESLFLIFFCQPKTTPPKKYSISFLKKKKKCEVEINLKAYTVVICMPTTNRPQTSLSFLLANVTTAPWQLHNAHEIISCKYK